MTEFFTSNTVQLELWLQLIFNLDDQTKASKIYVLSKLSYIFCGLDKSKHPKEIFERNFMFTSAAIKHSHFVVVLQSQCLLVPHSSPK